MSDPKLAAQLNIQSAAAPWEAKANSIPWSAEGTDRSGFARSTMQEGRVVSCEMGRATRTSTEAIANGQNRQAGTPYTYARDHITGNQIGPSEVTENSIVEIRGCEVTVAQARALGWMDATAPTAPNNQRNAPSITETVQHSDDAIASDLKGTPFSNPQVEQNYNALVQGVPGIEQMEAVQQIVETGEISEHTLIAAASAMQLEPEHLQGAIGSIMQAAEAEARAVMSEGGIDSDAVVSWAKQHEPDLLRNAMHNHAKLRQTTGYADVRRAYLESLGEHNPEAALAADLGPGVSQYLDKGRVVVRLPSGATMLWRQALSAFASR